ncbi:NCAN [Branchiostoma lanceolatum]|nr:NCAN [Branchiostoma lanceolatum]
MKYKPQVLPKLTCRAGYSLHKDMCYKAFTTPRSWEGAYGRCLSHECGQLAEPRTQNIDEFLISLKNAADPKNKFWFGLRRNRDVSLREQFHWATNPVDIVRVNASYTNWAPGRPDDELGYEDCVFYVAKDLSYSDTWNNAPCFTGLPYLCSTKPLEIQ